MIQEFRDFLFRGNIIELAVAFVMGVAFAAVVNSLVDNLVMPVIARGMPDEERRHQELLAALGRVGSR